MEQQGPRIRFNKREFMLCGLGTILVSEASATATALYQQSTELYQTAFYDPDAQPGDMGNFNKATELRLLAEELEKYDPNLSSENVIELMDDFEAFLREAS